MNPERITFDTIDGVTIVGDWTLPEGAKKAALLLHMMPSLRASFAPLAAELNKAGVATLAIDLRGHGESTKRKKVPGRENHDVLDYKKFTAGDHQASRLDVDASINFIKRNGFEEKDIVISGASIGANLALDAMNRYKAIGQGVILSPGLDYHGVKAEDALQGLEGDQKVWLLAAEEDEYSAESVARLAEIKKAHATQTIYKGIEHGTDLLEHEKGLIAQCAQFLCGRQA